jgi:hypothetical protein
MNATLVSGYAQTIVVWNFPWRDTLIFARTLEAVVDMTSEHCKVLFDPELYDEPSDIVVSAPKPTAVELNAMSLEELNEFGSLILPSEYRGQELNLN